MEQWLSENRELLIAIFGAGGVGTVLITALVRRRRGNGGSGGVSAHAENHGIAALHTGTGDIDVRVNAPISQEQLSQIGAQLGLSVSQVATLVRIAKEAGLDAVALERAVRGISHDQEASGKVQAALVEGADAVVAGILTHHDAAASQPAAGSRRAP